MYSRGQFSNRFENMWVLCISSNKRMEKKAYNYKLYKLFQRPKIIKENRTGRLCKKPESF